MPYLVRVLICLALFATAPAAAEDRPALPGYVIAQFGTPPPVPSGPLPADVAAAIDTLLTYAVDQSSWPPTDTAPFEAITASADPRLAWTLADMQRFAWNPVFRAQLARTAEALLHTTFETGFKRDEAINTLMAWDIPAYPGYLAHKRQVFTHYIDGWDRIMVEGDIAWQLVDWGGVMIDARGYNQTDAPCNCIPAIDNPTVEPAAKATWLQDDDVIFGVVVGGEARAYPRRIMEVREMVNDSLGGRDIAIPYCTLCGAAQGYFTDRMPDGVARPILRTSGLLIRSNKVMYDVETYSVFDTFLGKAVTGPLADIGLSLDKVTIITSDWGSWRAAHPKTTVLTENLALGRDFNLRETRDANGPIFPVGDVDPRLPVHEDVIGVIAPDGTPIAFPRARAMAALISGAEVSTNGIALKSEAGGLRASASDGSDLGSHDAFWFAWAQFHPDTILWGANE